LGLCENSAQKNGLGIDLAGVFLQGRRCRTGSRARNQKLSQTAGKKNPAEAGSSGGRYWSAAGGYADQIALEIIRDPPADERVPRGLQPAIHRSIDQRLRVRGFADKILGLISQPFRLIKVP